MKITRKQLRKFIIESMMPGKLGDGGMGSGRFPGDEKLPDVQVFPDELSFPSPDSVDPYEPPEIPDRLPSPDSVDPYVASQSISGNIELGDGSAGQDRLVYVLTIDGQFVNGSISHRQAPLIAADAVSKTMDGSFDGDLQYLLSNFGAVWAQMLQTDHGINVSPQAMSSAAQSGSINFRRMAKPRNTSFSYGE